MCLSAGVMSTRTQCSGRTWLAAKTAADLRKASDAGTTRSAADPHEVDDATTGQGDCDQHAGNVERQCDQWAMAPRNCEPLAAGIEGLPQSSPSAAASDGGVTRYPIEVKALLTSAVAVIESCSTSTRLAPPGTRSTRTAVTPATPSIRLDSVPAHPVQFNPLTMTVLFTANPPQSWRPCHGPRDCDDGYVICIG